jgi:hypothetical protein
MKAWQLGETSDGSHLLRAARKYAARFNDPEYVDAIALFIKEEQKHGSNLGRYIDLIGEKRLKRDWGDMLFRKIRYFNTSMELWTITVIIVESAAQVFYQALHDATRCTLLKSICSDILIDESFHIRFQNERLYRMFHSKSLLSKITSMLGYAAIFFGTLNAVWIGHRRAFKTGGISQPEYYRLMYLKFFQSMKFLHTKRTHLVREPELLRGNR